MQGTVKEQDWGICEICGGVGHSCLTQAINSKPSTNFWALDTQSVDSKWIIPTPSPPRSKSPLSRSTSSVSYENSGHQNGHERENGSTKSTSCNPSSPHFSTGSTSNTPISETFNLGNNNNSKKKPKSVDMDMKRELRSSIRRSIRKNTYSFDSILLELPKFPSTVATQQRKESKSITVQTEATDVPAVPVAVKEEQDEKKLGKFNKFFARQKKGKGKKSFLMKILNKMRKLRYHSKVDGDEKRSC